MPLGFKGQRVSEQPTGRGALLAGGLAAILASTCCLGPLLLVALGFSGAWIGNLMALEPYRPIFIGAALVAMSFAWRRIYRPAQDCKPGEVCATRAGAQQLQVHLLDRGRPGARRARIPIRPSLVLLIRSSP